jgi:hypothetical protein
MVDWAGFGYSQTMCVNCSRIYKRGFREEQEEENHKTKRQGDEVE